VGRKHREVPASLARLRRRFAAWRKQRAAGERIPAGLWKAAAKQAAIHGVSQTSAALKLSYYSLKEHVDQQPQVASTPAFVEVMPPPIQFARECVIECEDAAGSRMRVHLKGCKAGEVLAWGRAFFGDRE
jgi:hypothetical protein